MLETLEQRVMFAAVATDKADYAFGSTALIYGADFKPNQVIQLQVMHVAGTPGSNADAQNLPWTAQADANGSFASSWIVNDPDARGATYELNASGLSSGEIAHTNFT